MSALEVSSFHVIALYESTFRPTYLLTYLLTRPITESTTGCYCYIYLLYKLFYRDITSEHTGPLLVPFRGDKLHCGTPMHIAKGHALQDGDCNNRR